MKDKALPLRESVGEVFSPRRTRAPKGKGKGVVTFRCEAETARFLREGSAEQGISVTAFIVLCIRLVVEFYGLPGETSKALRRERSALGMTALEYVHYIFFMRALEIRKKGVGFELPEADRRQLGLGGTRRRG